MAVIGFFSVMALAVGINIGIWGDQQVPFFPAIWIPLGAGGLGYLLGKIAARA